MFLLVCMIGLAVFIGINENSSTANGDGRLLQAPVAAENEHCEAAKPSDISFPTSDKGFISPPIPRHELTRMNQYECLLQLIRHSLERRVINEPNLRLRTEPPKSRQLKAYEGEAEDFIKGGVLFCHNPKLLRLHEGDGVYSKYLSIVVEGNQIHEIMAEPEYYDPLADINQLYMINAEIRQVEKFGDQCLH